LCQKPLKAGSLAGLPFPPVSARPVYSGVVEHSVYIAAEARGLGLGEALLRALAESTQADGIWTIQASVFPENEASLKLHLANGYVVAITAIAVSGRGLEQACSSAEGEAPQRGADEDGRRRCPHLRAARRRQLLEAQPDPNRRVVT
jgi:hypothetical protein